jgi:acetyl esterase/lipase
MGAPEYEDILCFHYLKVANCVIVSVDYRLAPENSFPAGLEDCYSALVWLSENGEELGIDSSRIAVAGGSGGGGLTAALSLLVRDRNGPKIIFQMPLYPMIDDRMITSSSQEFSDFRIWSKDSNTVAWKMYLNETCSEETLPYAAPSRANDYSGFPPTYTFIGELDLFRDETLDYVNKLSKAGVHVEFTLYPKCFHGFEYFVPSARVSRRALTAAAQALKRALHQK